MKETLLYVIESLVDDKDQIKITESVKESGEILFEVRVASTDMGKIIGRQGRIAKEIRTLIKSMAIRENKRVSVDILD